MDHKSLINPVLDLACAAGVEIMKIYRTDFDVIEKKDSSPVTDADMAAHHIIVDGLQALTPTIPVLSEESAEIPFDTRQGWQRYWLIDPLDGTREFVKRNDEFTVNIALIEHGRSVLGVISSPVSGECYFAYQGGGAYKKVKEQERAEKISVQASCRNPVVIAGSRSHLSKRFSRLLARVGEHQVIQMGSSLKSCLVAEGVADIYARLGPTSEWDTAAAQCIVEEAGGFLTNLQGEPLRYNTKPSLLNPEFIVYGDSDKPWCELVRDI